MKIACFPSIFAIFLGKIKLTSASLKFLEQEEINVMKIIKTNFNITYHNFFIKFLKENIKTASFHLPFLILITNYFFLDKILYPHLFSARSQTRLVCFGILTSNLLNFTMLLVNNILFTPFQL